MLVGYRLGLLALLCAAAWPSTGAAQDTSAEDNSAEDDSAEDNSAEDNSAEDNSAGTSAEDNSAEDATRDAVTVRFAFLGPAIEQRHRRAARVAGDALSTLLGEPLRIEVAVGTYEELTTWVGRETVDVALLPVVAYGTVRGNPRVHALAGSEQRVPFDASPHGRRHYRSIAVTRAGSPFARDGDEAVPIASLRQAIEGAPLTFVHPLSSSGFVVPMAVLGEAGIEVPTERVRFAFTHERTRELLAAEGSDGRETLAFLSGDQWERSREDPSQRLARIRIAELEDVPIPSDVLVVTTGLLDRLAAARGEGTSQDTLLERMRSAIGEWARTPERVEVLGEIGLAGFVPPVEDDYAAFLERYVPAVFDRDRVRPSDIRYSARQLMQRIEALRLAATRSGDAPPRVALVLSGGGNKCAFEAGVLRELYVEGFTPDVVVGTSGGAFNALATVAGFAEARTAIDGTRAGVPQPTQLEQLWLSLRERDVVPIFCALTALTLWFVWTAFLGLNLLALRAALFGRFQIAVDGDLAAIDEDDGTPEKWARRRKRAKRNAILATASFAVIGLLAALAILFEEQLPFRWGPLGIARAGAIFGASAGFVQLGAVALVVEGDVPASGPRHLARLLLTRAARWTRSGLTAIGLVALLAYVGRASELLPVSQVRDHLTRLVEEGALEHVEDRPGMTHPEAVSAALGDGPMRADLVLTVTPFGGDGLRRLPVDSPLVEHDVRQHYMWFPEDGDELQVLLDDPAAALVHERRLRWFQPLPHRHMIDTAASSGALFPIFGMHELVVDGRHSRFIDGGYGHNIPIEAAMLWGAGIIVVIRASPEGSTPGADDILGNLAQAFETLYDRAQRPDDPRARGTAVFEVGPTQSYEILSFHPDDLARAVLDGRAAAAHPSIVGEAGFAELSGAAPRVELVRRPGHRASSAEPPATP